MGEISFTSELSQNSSGHITRVMPLLQRLRELGHSSHLILRDLSPLHHLVKGQAPTALQAPLWLPRMVNAMQPLNYADILLAAGYADTRGLRALTHAWMRLFELNGSALVIADHSPTAMLAARIMQVPCVTLGSGFCAPPLLSSLPPLCWWQEADSERLQSSEDLVLASINEVLALYAAQPLSSLSELFAVEETFLRTFAELDHYPQRAIKQDPKPVYLGPELPLDGGEEPRWPDAPGPRVYASLDTHWAGFEDLLTTFQALPISVLAHVPSLTTAQQQTYSSANLRVTSKMQKMESVRQQCEFAVCHGELAIVSAMLTAGRPLLLAPTQLEQTIVCRNVERLRAGLTLRTDTKRHPPQRLLKYLLDEPGFTTQANAFAQSYKDYDQEAARDGIAARCDEILRAAEIEH